MQILSTVTQSRDNIYVFDDLFKFVQNVGEYLPDHTASHPLTAITRYHFLCEANLVNTHVNSTNARRHEANI
jgi:hypothetical protein